MWESGVDLDTNERAAKQSGIYFTLAVVSEDLHFLRKELRDEDTYFRNYLL